MLALGKSITSFMHVSRGPVPPFKSGARPTLSCVGRRSGCSIAAVVIVNCASVANAIAAICIVPSARRWAGPKLAAERAPDISGRCAVLAVTPPVRDPTELAAQNKR